jgi:diguanylate cyclase (GGDEF)-like protein
MQLDVQTLSVVTVFVTALLGALLVFAGLQNRAMRAPMLWGAAYVIQATGQALLIGQGTTAGPLALAIGNEFILLGTAGIWAGSRLFDNRPVSAITVLAGPGFWLAACALPIFANNAQLRLVLVSALMAMLSAATAEEFWRGRSEPLMSRWPTVCALLANAAVLLARIPAVLLSPLLPSESLMSGISFALLAFGTLLFTVVLAFLLLNMTKERTELQHKIASLIDPLSGVPNRRAFIDGAERLLAQQRIELEPLAVVLFDLDRFKAINDERGHGVGDAVLQTFANTAAQTLGGDVLFGRIGGEEFAAMLPVGDLGEAVAVADRVRRNVAQDAQTHAPGDLRPTVSAGVTLGRDPKISVTVLLAAADQALYRAKSAGRNRVETADVSVPDAADVSERAPGARRWRRAAAHA